MAGVSEKIAQAEAEKSRFDTWVSSMGGFTGRRFAALHREALEMAGPDGYWRYLEMARAADEDYAAHQRDREARRRAAAAQAAAEAAAQACLQRTSEIRLAMDELRGDPRVASALEGPGLSPAEVAAQVYASMGLAARPAPRYETSAASVDEIARAIGVKW